MKKLAVFASGAGSTLKFLLDRQRANALLWQIAVVVSDRKGTGAELIASENNIQFLSSRDENAVLNQLLEAQVDLVLLAGYLRKVPNSLLKMLPDRVINSHPSLLPKYGGLGMYGRRVHEAVFAASEEETGVTVHLVNSEYDKGQVLVQKRISIQDCQSAEEIEERVKAEEKKVLLNYLNSFAQA